MKYKTRKIPGAPDWIPEGVVCRVRQGGVMLEREELITGYDQNSAYPFVTYNDKFSYAEPIPAWEPTPGEYCAFWDSWYNAFWVAEFGRKTVDKVCPYETTNEIQYEHIARITGVDCACSLDELKERTDWL